MPAPDPGSTDDVLFYSPLRPVVRALSGTLSPNTITVMGIIPSALVVIAILERDVILALLAFILRYAFDCLDGSVARETNQTSEFGAWLDWAVDSILTVAIFAALAATYTNINPLVAGAAVMILLPCATHLIHTPRVHNDLFLCEFLPLLGALMLGEYSIRRGSSM